MATLNHLKKGESLEDKQLIIINSTNRDMSEQTTSSFTYTFDQPIERVSKIDVMYVKIPKLYYNVNSDNATMSITTQTFDEKITTNLVVNDEEIAKNVIEATNVVNGTVVKTNTSIGNGAISYSNVISKNSFIYTAGTYFNNLIDFNDFTGATADKPLSNIGLTNLFVAKYSLEQILNLRFRISGIIEDKYINIDVSNDDIFISGIFRSFPLTFYNANDSVAGKLVSDGNPTSFIARYTNLGVHIWKLKIFGIDSEINPTKIVYNSVDNTVYVAGTYSRTVEIYDISSSVNPVNITSFNYTGPGTHIFVAQFSIDGDIMWVSKIEGNCILRSMVVAPSGNVILGIEFLSTLKFYGTHPIFPLNPNDLILDGLQNLALVEYDKTGTLFNRLKIGGSNIDSNIQLDIVQNTLAVSGLYSSNPLRFYSNTDVLQNTLDIDGLFNNIFISKYDLTDPTDKQIIWRANIYDESNSIDELSVSLTIANDIIVCGNYATLLKFNDSSNVYQIGKDLLNSLDVNFAFVAKYDTDGNFKQRSYIEVPITGQANGFDIDAHSNNIFMVGSYLNTASVYNSDNTLSKTLENTTGTTNGMIISYVNNINNYTIDTTTLNTRIICRTLTGTDLNYILNLNAFSQRLGLDTSEKFQAIIFGNPISWANLNVDATNDKFIINFKIGDTTTKIFKTFVKTFKITHVSNPGYTPYSLAFELSKIIQKNLNNDADVPFNQTNPAVVYSAEKKIFYFQFIINGTFTIDTTCPLTNTTGLNAPVVIPPVVSEHCIITNTNVNSEEIDVTDNSKISVKLSEDIINTRFNNVNFSTAFPNISGNSGLLKLIASLDSKMSATAGGLADDLNTDLQVGDSVSFDSPWLRADPNENTFINALKWSSVSISGDGFKQTAVANGDKIYLSTNKGQSWVSKESRKKWCGVSISENATFQTAVVTNGQIYISVNEGVSWIPKETNRDWRHVAVSRKAGGGRTEGQYQTAVARGDRIYVSVDSGNSWIARSEIRDWQSVDISSTGIIQTAVIFGGSIYNSPDSGITWNEIAGTEDDWQDISMINDGTTQVAVTFVGTMRISNNSGVTWGASITVSVGSILTSVAIAPDNDQEIFVVGNAGSIYTSHDGGGTWEDFGFNESFTSIASSETGDTTTAIVSSGGIYEGSFGIGWIDIVDAKVWKFITMSADGVTQYAVADTNIYKSIDSGNTWRLLLSTFLGRHGIFNSADGNYIISVSSSTVRVSNNGGDSFITHNFITSECRPGMSATGQYMTSGTNLDLRVSEDYGQTFVVRGPTGSIFDQVAVSSDGLTQIVVSRDGPIYKTTDAWVSWENLNLNSNWRICAISANGQYMLVGGFRTSLYVSSDGGNSWNIAILPSSVWWGVSMSATGQVQIASVIGELIYVSTDFGVTWSNRDKSRNWFDVAVSADGKKQAAVVQGVNIFESTNSGLTWGRRRLIYSNPFNALSYSAAAISDNGQYITIVAQGNFIFVSRNYGKSFVFKGTKQSYVDVAMSADGQKQVALGEFGSGFSGNVHTSLDGGLTWVQTNISGFWRRIAMSADGNVVTILGSNTQIKTSVGGAAFVDDAGSISNKWSDIDMSDDGTIKYATVNTGGIWKFSGGTWTQVHAFQSHGIACDSTGSKVTVSNTSQLQYSSDGLATFEVPNPRGPLILIEKIAMSADGSVQTCIGSDGRLYVSTDNWANFERVNSNRDWRGLSMTRDGTQHISTVYPGHIYQSFDSGAHWGIQQTNRQPVSIAISGDASIQTIVSSGREIYSSTNEGNSWITRGISNNWRDIAVSRTNGSVQVAIPFNGQIYVSTDTGVTWSLTESIRDWRHVAVSANGTNITALAKNDQIYNSSNSGGTWFAKDSARNWRAVAMSDDATIQIAIVTGGQIYVSNGDINSWIPEELNRSWSGIAVSSNGLTRTAIVYGGQIYTYDNTGSIWIARESNRNWQSIDMSSNGLIQTAVVWGGQIYVSLNSGSTWTAYDQNRDWLSVSLSNDGLFQTAIVFNDEIYQSFDNGKTWSIQIGLNEITSIDMSADSVTQLVAKTGDTLYLSTSTGQFWTPQEEVRNWRSVAVTPTGYYLTAVEYGGKIYNSIGSNWTDVESDRNWQSIVMTSNGQIRAAVVDNGKIYVSTDFGVNYTPYATDQRWRSIALNNSGLLMTAVAYNAQIYVSGNTGTDWTAVVGTLVLNWQDVSMSLDGSIRTAVVQGGQIYVSIDSGVTWLPKDENRNWVKVDVSDSGVEQIAITNGDKIYSSVDTGNTWHPSELPQQWRGIVINGDAKLQMTADTKTVSIHNFNLNQRLEFNINAIDSDPNIHDHFSAEEIVTQDLVVLHDFNMGDGLNFTIVRKEPANAVDIFVPPANYTPATLVTTINALLSSINIDFANAFSYNPVTGKISFTSEFSGSNLIEPSSLLTQMGFTELPSTITAGAPIVANAVINEDLSGPLNIFIKSNIIGNAKKHPTAFSTNKKLKNLIAPLELHEETNTFRVPTTVEIFLSKKETISTLDMQIVDDQGNIVNLNNGVVQINMYFYSS